MTGPLGRWGGNHGHGEHMTSMILSLSHGWVLAGQVDTIDRDRIHLIQAAVIRVCGAPEGLGGLVAGPVNDTVLDPIAAPVIVNKRQTLFTFQATGWTWPEAPMKTKVSSRLAVLTHGWVLAGAVVDDMEEPESGIQFERAAVIRRWGTTRGIGQLVTGPTPLTELRPIPSELHALDNSYIFTFPVTGWEASFRP